MVRYANAGLKIGDRVVCAKGERNYEELVVGKAYTVKDKTKDYRGQFIYKLLSDDGIPVSWIEQYEDMFDMEHDLENDLAAIEKSREKSYFMPIDAWREIQLEKIL